MASTARCAFRKPTGEPCAAPPLHDGSFCLMHSPEHAADVAEARRLGGLRRRRESTLAGAYEFEDLESVQAIRRLLHISVLDTLALENSIARSRTLAYLAQVALKALELGDLESRLSSLEAATAPGPDGSSPLVAARGPRRERLAPSLE